MTWVVFLWSKEARRVVSPRPLTACSILSSSFLVRSSVSRIETAILVRTISVMLLCYSTQCSSPFLHSSRRGPSNTLWPSRLGSLPCPNKVLGHCGPTVSLTRRVHIEGKNSARYIGAPLKPPNFATKHIVQSTSEVMFNISLCSVGMKFVSAGLHANVLQTT